MSNKPTYVIKEGQGDDPRIVVKKAVDIDIPLNQVADELIYFKKTVTELEENAKIQEATMKNIVDHNPDIEVLADEKMNAVMLYYQAKLKATMLRDKLKEAQATMVELEQMSKDIEEQTGLKAIEQPKE